MSGVPLPKTTNLSLLLLTLGILANTSLAEPALLNKLFWTSVTRALPFIKTTGCVPSTTTSCNACTSGDICILGSFNSDVFL